MDPNVTRVGNDAITYSRKPGIMRLCMIGSFVFHVFALITINRAFPIHWIIEPLRIYQVELIRPPVKDMELDKDAQGLTRLNEDNSKSTLQGEDTISLDTTDKKYVSYAKIIKQALMAQWNYPEAARDNLMEGRTLLLFTLSREGALQDLRLISSSGYMILDSEAMRAVRAAAPFPAFPGSVTVARLHIKANFDYKLTGTGPS